MNSKILEKFYSTLAADEQQLIKDYIAKPDPEVLSESFDNLIQSNEN